MNAFRDQITIPPFAFPPSPFALQTSSTPSKLPPSPPFPLSPFPFRTLNETLFDTL